MLEPIAIQSQAGGPEQLFFLFHGVGSTPQDMVPLGRLLATEFPRAAVISVPSPDISDIGSGCPLLGPG
jgi:phospholipase/carboxylesterase